MKRVTLVVLVLCWPALAGAKEYVPAWAALTQDTTTLSGQTLAHGSGIAAVNEAAGNNNLQANADALSLGPSAGSAIHQSLTGNAAGLFNSEAVITGHAFAGFSGIINVNQASGNGNLEANVVAIGTHLTPLTDTELGQVASTVTQTAADLPSSAPGGHRHIAVGAGAFSGASGIVQISQTVGAANRLANSFSLNISAGVTP
ncbi:MAG: hypothetical protein ACYCXG_03525 [Acidiferrobacter sp.]